MVLFAIPINNFAQNMDSVKISYLEYCVGDINDSIYDIDDKVFKPLVKTTSLERFLPEGQNKGVVWIKAEFDLPKNLYNENLGVILGKIIMADETYFNGILIGKSGSMKPKIYNNWNHYRYYNLNSNVVKENGNELYIKIFGHEELDLRGKITVGKIDYLDKLFSKYQFYTEKLNLYIALILLFYSIFPFINFLQDRKRIETLYFTFVLWSYTIYSTNYFSNLLFDTTDPPIGNIVQQKIVFVSLTFVLYFLFKTMRTFLGKVDSKVMRIFSLSVVVILLILFIFAPTYHAMQLFRIVIYIPMLMMFVYIVAVDIKELLKKNLEALLLSICLIPTFIIVIHDVFFSINATFRLNIVPLFSFDDGPIYFASYSGALLLISFGIIMTTRYTKNVRIIEDMNKSLEAQIKKRTKQLSQQKDKLFNMNRKMIDELNLAKKIQQRLMPETDPTDYISSFYLPMNHVGGDLYEYVKFDDGRIGVFISDVSGHGVPSAFITLMIKTVLLDIGNIIDDPSEVMDKINNVLYKNTAGHFITALYGIYDPVKRSFKYSCAGHYPPIILTKDGLEYLNVSKTYPLAVMKLKRMKKLDKSFANNLIELEKGSKLLFFTDGFVDAKSKDDDSMLFQYGEMDNVLKKCLKYNSKKFVKEVHASLRLFTGNRSFDDDVCFICLDVL